MDREKSLGGFLSAEARAEFEKVYGEAMAELPPPARDFTIETDFGTVKAYRFEKAGVESRTPLLLLPGKSAPMPMWEANLPSLMEIAPVYAIDILGEPGLSVQTAPIRTPAEQAAWLHQVLMALPEPALHVLGLSFGGWSAVNLALHHAEKIESLILIDPVHVFAGIPLKTLLITIPASLPVVPRVFRDKLLSHISGGADISEDVTTARLIETSMRAFRSKLPPPTRISAEQLASIQAPTLAIIAEKSAIHDARKAMAFGKSHLCAAGSEMVLFENATHAINGEFPEKLAETVASFVRAFS